MVKSINWKLINKYYVTQKFGLTNNNKNIYVSTPKRVLKWYGLLNKLIVSFNIVIGRDGALGWSVRP